MIFIGIAIGWVLAALWQYAIAGLLILMGIWFLVWGFLRIT
jgi:hypothetical protein